MVYIIFTIFQRSKWENEIQRKSSTKLFFYEISDFLFFIGVLALSIILISQLLLLLEIDDIFYFSSLFPGQFFSARLQNYGVEAVFIVDVFSNRFSEFFFVVVCALGGKIIIIL